MRFVPDGPEIPDVLVSAQEQGTVLFVCGAGASMTAGLPSFRCLAQSVYRQLGEDWDLHHAEREVMRKNGQLEGQYDRMLRSLERRLAASDVRGEQGMRRRIREAIEAALALPSATDLPNHLALLELSRDEEGRPRLLTTNFDPLFERAWHQARQPAIPSHAGPAMPRPGTGSFDGVLHLHGRVADTVLGLAGTDLVLNSAEFGEAYLRSGWAARYVYDLARAYTLVLVGYQADDPPMRYLLEVLEADRARYPDLKTVYAFAPATDGDEDLQRALWNAKGIEPVLYRNDDSRDHSRLYDTLQVWRDYAVSPTGWREQRLRTIVAADPHAGNAKNIGDAAALLMHGDAANLLAKILPGADWWAPLATHAALRDRGDVLGLWIAGRLDDPEMLRACAASQPRDVRAYQHLRMVLDLDRADVPPALAKGWRLFVQAGLAPRHGDRSLLWYTLAARVKRADIDHGVRKAIVDCIRPRLRIGQPFDWPGRKKTEEGSDLLGQLLRIEFDSDGHPTARDVLEAWPSDIEQEVALFRVAERALAAALDQAHDAGHLGKFDRASYDVASLSGDGGLLERGFFPIARLAAGLWDRIALKDASRARVLATAWSDKPYLLQTRLYLRTHAARDVHSGEEVSAVLIALDDKTLWISDAQREIGNLLTMRWPDLSETARSSLETRLCAGLPRGLARPGDTMPEIEWQAISDHLVFRLLEPIRRAGGELTSKALAVLDDIKARHPATSLTLSGEEAVYVGGFTGSRGHPERMAEMPDDALVREVLRMQQAEKWAEGNVWQLLCEAEPYRALRAVRATIEAADRWRPEVIGPLLSTASRVDDSDFQAAMANLVTDMPDEMLPRHTADVAYWLQERAEKAGTDSKLPAQFMTVWDRLADVVYTPTADSIISPSASTMDAALNSTGGRVALALRTILCAREWPKGRGFGSEMQRRLDRLVNAPGVAGLHARLLFVRVLAFLDRVDPDWTARNLVPLLSWTHPEAGALWTAWAGGSIGSAGLFNAIKAPFLDAFRRHGETQHADDRLATSLVQVAVWKQEPAASAYDLTFSEVRGALSVATPAARRQTAWHFWRWMAGEKDEVFDRADRWRSRAGPLFNDIWPLDARARDAGVSHALVLMVLECGDAFPEAVMAVVDFLIPHDITSVNASLGLETLHQAVTAKFPSFFLRLLNAIVDPRIARVPFDLGEVLDRCRASSPGIEQERAFLRLDGLRRQREA